MKCQIKDNMTIAETKDREDVDVAAKDLQGEHWAEEVSKRTGVKWTFLRVDQKDFEKTKYNNLT